LHRSSIASSRRGCIRNERQAFLPYLVATPVLFLLGSALVYFFIIPMAMWFFLSMEQSWRGGAGLDPASAEGLGISQPDHDADLRFRAGISSCRWRSRLMARAGLVTTEGLAAKRKYAIVFAFIAAAILTPPDPLTQIGLAVPTILLYELSILSARYVEKQKREAEQMAGGDGDERSGGRRRRFVRHQVVLRAARRALPLTVAAFRRHPTQFPESPFSQDVSHARYPLDP
jgi:sec-independent protein translocase protein TatC